MFGKKKSMAEEQPAWSVQLSIESSGGLVTVKDGSRVLFDGPEPDVAVTFLALASVLGTGEARKLVDRLAQEGL